jgi:hypothetical protein
MVDYLPFENLMAPIQHPAHGEGRLHCQAKAETAHKALQPSG